MDIRQLLTRAPRRGMRIFQPGSRRPDATLTPACPACPQWTVAARGTGGTLCRPGARCQSGFRDGKPLDGTGRADRDAQLSISPALACGVPGAGRRERGRRRGARPGPRAGAASGCQVSYRVNQWTGGFVAYVDVTAGANPVHGWTVTWTYPAGQQISSAWSAQVSQVGAAVTATGLGYNGDLAANASTEFGVQGTWTGSNPTPTDLAVTGSGCATATSSTPSAGRSASPSPSGSPTGAPPAGCGPRCSATASRTSPADAVRRLEPQLRTAPGPVPPSSTPPPRTAAAGP